MVCSLIDVLGDEFDLLVFHSEFRVDSQEGGAGFLQYWKNINVEGLGDLWGSVAPCGSAQLKGRWSAPVWMKSINVLDATSPEGRRFDFGSMFFAHEFTHMWTAYASMVKAGRQRESLYGNYCRCHWRFDLHAPAAFPYSADEARSVMGGRFWRENGDGTFTPLNNYYAGGHSWLDLYMMGLASASEVPDMFILRDARPVNAGSLGGPHTGEKEIVSIEQIVAAEGPRIPPVEDAQKDFNVGFVYLLAHGRTPDAGLLRVHAEYRGKVIEHWSHIAGGRSRMMTTVPGVANRSPVPVGTLGDLTLQAGRAADVDVSAAFRDPDGDPVTYDATSSASAVATVAVSGSTVTVTAVAAGTATVGVTATDAGGSNTAATLAFRVTVRARVTFTDDPIVAGVTPVKAVHFAELRERIDLLRSVAELEPFSWTDPVLTAGVTPVRVTHLLELRRALAVAYAAFGRAAPTYTDAAPMSGTTLRAAHLTELRAAVLALR